MSTENLTEKQIAVLKALRFNFYGEGWSTWGWATDDSEYPTGFDPRTIAGVLSSLQSAGYIKCQGEGDESTIDTTQKGMDAMDELFGDLYNS